MLFAMPQQVQASCCSSETSCQTEATSDHHNEPCGSSTCDCICCGSVSVLLLKKVTLEEEASPSHNKKVISTYTSLKGTLFHTSIWQPPRLG